MSRKSKALAFADEVYDIHVTGRHVLITDAMKDYVIEKISKIEKFSSRIIDVSVTMDIQRNVQRVDIVAKVDNALIKSSAALSDMYASIDEAVKKLETQILRYKSRIQEHKDRHLNNATIFVDVIRAAKRAELDEINEEIEDENRRSLIDKYLPHTIVRREAVPLKLLTVDEAIKKMEQSEETFLIFRNEKDPQQRVTVINRRDDGNYGIFELQA